MTFTKVAKVRLDLIVMLLSIARSESLNFEQSLLIKRCPAKEDVHLTKQA